MNTIDRYFFWSKYCTDHLLDDNFLFPDYIVEKIINWDEENISKNEFFNKLEYYTLWEFITELKILQSKWILYINKEFSYPESFNLSFRDISFIVEEKSMLIEELIKFLENDCLEKTFYNIYWEWNPELWYKITSSSEMYLRDWYNNLWKIAWLSSIDNETINVIINNN